MAKTTAKAAKRKTVKKAKKVLVGRGTLRHALLSGLKAGTGRKDINYRDAPELATSTQEGIPIAERAGYPVKRAPGSVDPKDWVTKNGVKVHVDFSRAKWLPDDWGQGVKTTSPTSHSTGGNGGILTCYVAPDCTIFFHKERSEEYFGRKLTDADGKNGQVRFAQLQAKNAVQLARAQIKDSGKKGSQELIGTDPDEEFFKILTPAERKCLPKKEELHFCVISARRAGNFEGIKDCTMVQSQLREAGVTPIWYVDKPSLKEYKALGVNAVEDGGSLTKARNKALTDARKKGLACVQISDDIAAWEYRHGPQATQKSDDAQNKAHAKARRFIVSPVAAAQFIVAKMRGADAPRPRLGGVYCLASCARTFGQAPFSRKNFIIGDFFVDDNSGVLFDTEMKLKEDYDFTMCHIKKHGSVMRLNRMTLNVKHYSNGGGAVSNRDAKEEKRNISIIFRKHPGNFRMSPKRKNEVILQCKRTAGKGNDDGNEDGSDDDDEEEPKATGKMKKARRAVRKANLKAKKQPARAGGVLQKPGSKIGEFPPNATVEYQKAASTFAKNGYITKRCLRASGLTVETLLGGFTYTDTDGVQKRYLLSDLRYDLKTGRLKIVKGSKPAAGQVVKTTGVKK